MEKITMLNRKLLSILIVFAIAFQSLILLGCDNTDKQIRLHIKDAITATNGIVSAIQSQIPPTDSRYEKLKLFQQALERFENEFNQNPGDDNKVLLLQLFADLVTSFRAAVLPLLPFGGAVAIAIVAVDTALRFIATRFSNMIAKHKIKIETLATRDTRDVILSCDKVLIDFLATSECTY